MVRCPYSEQVKDMIQVDWARSVQNTVVWHFTSPWTWEEFTDAKQHADAMIDTVSGVVDTIFVTAKDDAIPPSGLVNLRNLINKRHPRNDLMIVVGAHNFVTAIVNIVIAAMPSFSSQVQFVTTEEEALARVTQAQARRRDDLPVQS